MAGFAMAVLSAVARLKARKAKIVLLYCDNLASLDCVRGQFYRDALALSDHVIVPCKAMSVRARNFLPPITPVTVIKDPWQVRTQKFRLPKSERSLRIGWFGNANNINFLCENILSLMISIDKVSSVELVILSSKGALKTAQVALMHLCLHLSGLGVLNSFNGMTLFNLASLKMCWVPCMLSGCLPIPIVPSRVV